jgi:hypothetical protein
MNCWVFSLSPRERVGVRGKGSSANPTFTKRSAAPARFMESGHQKLTGV